MDLHVKTDVNEYSDDARQKLMDIDVEHDGHPFEIEG